MSENNRPYNTAIKSPRYEYPGRHSLGKTSVASTPRGMVFCHDISKPLPGKLYEFIALRAQCLYSEISWRAGYQTFAERAEADGFFDHSEYLSAIRRLIDALEKPAFIVCGKPEAARLKAPHTQPILLNGAQATLAVWGMLPASPVRTSGDLLTLLASRYRSVYDPCCGYGNALVPFSYFIGSDFDEKCLNYIEREILGDGCS